MDAAGKPGAVKRSLFNRPSWAKAQNTTEPVDFSRSKVIYSDIVREQEERRKKKQARRERLRQQQSGEDDAREGKRRRISLDSEKEDEEDDSSSDDDDSNPVVSARRRAQAAALADSEDDERPAAPPVDYEDDSPAPLPTRRKESSSAPGKKNPEPILLSSDDDDIPRPSPLNPPSTTTDASAPVAGSIVDDDSPASDEEFPELARKARERQRRLREEGRGTNGEASASRSDEKTGSRHSDQPSPDSSVSIFVTSRIAHTKPLLVQLRLQQRLKDLRLAWCGKQGFDDEAASAVFLTWRGIRLFDVTTCKSLGVGVDRDGTVVHHGTRDRLGDLDRQIHMEALTEEIMEEDRKKREKEQQGPDEDEDHGTSQSQSQPLEPREQIRVMLKSKGYDDFKLIVRPTTKISQIVHAFRLSRSVGAEQEVFLVFDGDRLDPEHMVTETEIADLDRIDVHVK
ncbi:MAG: hypothetical protein M1838_005670 [Thelocarpon superellum]|nr:MAG: hypothetical protein M1838_005670 [Thelocarpon superellum]